RLCRRQRPRTLQNLIARRILDDVGDCLADTWYFLQTVLRDNDLKRNAECEQAVRGARIGFGAERVAATKSAALSELAEQCRDGRCVEGGHFIDQDRNTRSSTGSS